MNKAKGTLVGVAAVSSTVLITNTLKSASIANDRMATTARAFRQATHPHQRCTRGLASRNLQAIDLSMPMHRMLDAGLYALTIGTSWSRIEAGWHYPSDTLFGMALGNFIASFVNDAFLGVEAPIALSATARARCCSGAAGSEEPWSNRERTQRAQINRRKMERRMESGARR